MQYCLGYQAAKLERGKSKNKLLHFFKEILAFVETNNLVQMSFETGRVVQCMTK